MTTANSPASKEVVTAALLVIGGKILSGRTQTDDFASAELERNVIDGDEAAEAPGNVSEPEHGAHGAASPIRRRQNTHPRPRSPRGRKRTRQTTMMPRRPA